MLQGIHPHTAALIESMQKAPGRLGVGGDSDAIDCEKGINRRKGSTFVAVDEGMILRQTLPQGCGLGDQVGVIAALRPEHGRLKLTEIAHPGRAAIARDLIIMHRQQFGDPEVIPCHCASC